MNEQVVEFVIRDRKFVFKIPYNDYVPFKEAEENNITHRRNKSSCRKIRCGLVYAALQLAIENNRLSQKTKNASSDTEQRIEEISEKLNIFLNQQ